VAGNQKRGNGTKGAGSGVQVSRSSEQVVEIPVRSKTGWAFLSEVKRWELEGEESEKGYPPACLSRWNKRGE